MYFNKFTKYICLIIIIDIILIKAQENPAENQVEDEEQERYECN